jgi:hypothetical protein
MDEAAAVPFDVLRMCQATAYLILEDMRELYAHVQEAASPNPADQFLNLVNRAQFAPGLDPSGDPGDDLLHRAFLLPPCSEDGDRALLGLVEDRLRAYDSAQGCIAPVWLRLFRAGYAAASRLGLRRPDGRAVLRWFAVNIEVPTSDRDPQSRIARTVNINSHEIRRVRMEKYPSRTGERVPVRPLTDILFDPTNAVAVSKNGHVVEGHYHVPYMCWGIRFSSGRHRDPELRVPWLAIDADLDNSQAYSQGLDAGPAPRLHLPGLPSAPLPVPQAAMGGAYFAKLLQNWAHGDDDRQLGDESEAIRAYCKTIQHFYPGDRWPARGVDSLVCPAVFWSLDPQHLGAAATMLWGCDGRLTNAECWVLLQLSQMLLAGIGQFARLADISASSRWLGRASAMHYIPSAFANSVEYLQNHQRAKGPECGFAVPEGLYLAALEASLAARGLDREAFFKSTLRLPSAERELTEHGVSDSLCQQLVAREGVARRLAEARLQTGARPMTPRQFRRPAVIVRGPDMPFPMLRLSDLEVQVFLGLLILLLKEAIEHTERYLRDRGAAMPTREIEVARDVQGDHISIAISNPCLPPERTLDANTGNGEASIKLFAGYLEGWSVEKPDITDDGRWVRRLSQKNAEA